MMAKLRHASYRAYAWPGFMAPLFDRPRLAATLLAVALPLAFALGIALLAQPGALVNHYPDAVGSFYAVIPHRVMAALFGVVGLFALLAIGVGVLRFWRESGESLSALFDLTPIAAPCTTRFDFVTSAAATPTKAAPILPIGRPCCAGSSIT